MPISTAADTARTELLVNGGGLPRVRLPLGVLGPDVSSPRGHATFRARPVTVDSCSTPRSEQSGSTPAISPFRP